MSRKKTWLLVHVGLFLAFTVPPLRGRSWRFTVVVDVTQFQPYSRPDSIISVDVSTYYIKVALIDSISSNNYSE